MVANMEGHVRSCLYLDPLNTVLSGDKLATNIVSRNVQSEEDEGLHEASVVPTQTACS
jgi:hypothetical protein